MRPIKEDGQSKLTIGLPSLQSLIDLKNPSSLALALKASTLIAAVISEANNNPPHRIERRNS